MPCAGLPLHSQHFNGGLYIYSSVGMTWLTPTAYGHLVSSFNVLWLGSLGVAQVYRYRYVSTTAEHRQTRVVVVGVVLGIGVNALVMASGTIATLDAGAGCGAWRDVCHWPCARWRHAGNSSCR